MGVGVSLITVTIFLLFPGQLISLFIRSGETETAEIIRIGTSLMLAAAAFQIVDATQVVALGLLRGSRTLPPR
jgi:MATE family multidrug resistance protein